MTLRNAFEDMATEATLIDVETSLADLLARTPASLGSKADAASFAVAKSTEDKAVAASANVLLAEIVAKILAARTGLPGQDDSYLLMQTMPQQSWRCGFDRAVAANGVDPEYLTLLHTGTGMGISQSGGSLLLTTGTTANSETIARSVRSFAGNVVMRYSTLMSQRILNNNFVIELVDVIGDALALTVNSATSVTVTIPGSTFTSGNVGQSMNIGAITGVAGVPGRWTIASVSGNTVTFTVAGWPASGSGTCSLFGWNYHQVLYNGTTVTANAVDCQRNGYASGATTATINTTAVSHVGTFSVSDGEAVYMDQTGASSITLEAVRRASRVRNVAVAETVLYLQLRALNGTTNPATTTTWTVGVVDISNYVAQPVSLANVSPMSANSGMPVEVINTAVPVSGTVTANIGTGAIAAGTNAIGDVGTQYRANATGAAAPVSVMSPVTPAAATIKGSAGRLVGWQLDNSAAALRSVKVFNATAPTLGTTSAAFEIDIPAGGRSEQNYPGGIGFATAITHSVTSAKGLTDNTSAGLALGDVSGSFFFA